MTQTYVACLYRTTNNQYNGIVSYLILLEANKVEEDRTNKVVKIPMPVAPKSAATPTSYFIDLKRIEGIILIAGYIGDQDAVINGAKTSITATQAKNHLSKNILNVQSKYFLAWRGIDSNFPENLGILSATGDATIVTRMGVATINACEVALDKLKYAENILRADRLSGGIRRYELQMNLFLGSNKWGP